MVVAKWAPFAVVVLIAFSCASAPPAPEPEAAAPAKTESRTRAQDLVTGGGAQTGGAAKDSTAAAAAKTAVAEAAPAAAPSAAAVPAAPAATAAEDMTPKEKQYFENYLKRLKYMMVVKDGSAVTDFQKRTILTKGNQQLTNQGYDVVQYDQLVKNMEDQRTAYEAEAGASMSLTQFIAQKLGADVYVELECLPQGSTESGRHYGMANFVANMYDPSTAEVIGSVTFRTDRSVSTVSQDDAVLNALSAGTAQLMPRVIRDSTTVLRNRYSNGIRYQLILQKTPDSRAVSAFRRNLGSRVREIVMGPSAADQTLMDVYFFGSLADLEDSCYDVFERTPGMESTYWVYTRGKTITFNTGN